MILSHLPWSCHCLLSPQPLSKYQMSCSYYQILQIKMYNKWCIRRKFDWFFFPLHISTCTCRFIVVVNHGQEQRWQNSFSLTNMEDVCMVNWLRLLTSNHKPNTTYMTNGLIPASNVYKHLPMTGIVQAFLSSEGQSWSWSYGSWIYNYLWNQCLSPLKLWVQIPLMARCTRYNFMW